MNGMTEQHTERIGGWIETYTGKQFWPLDPRPEDVCIEDIAHALSNICRFNGHCKHFYSVAQHSILLSDRQEMPNRLRLAALMHDAAEAYFGDIVRPIKSSVCIAMDTPVISLGDISRIGEVELVIVNTIFDALGIPIPNGSDWGVIKELDRRLLATEARDLLRPGLDCPHIRSIVPFDSSGIDEWYQVDVEIAFLSEFERLSRV